MCIPGGAFSIRNDMALLSEVRFDMDRDDLTVLDAYCQATGKARVDVMRKLLKSWADELVHTSTLVLRAKHINPLKPE